MKNKKVFFAMIAMLLVLSAFKIADQIIERLGMDQKTAQYYILNNFIGSFSTGKMEVGYDSYAEPFKIPYAKLLPSVIAGDKAAAAGELCEYVKKYISSEEFMVDYENRREGAMPLEIDGKTISRLKGDMNVYRKNINNYKTDAKYVAEQQALLDADQKTLDQLLEAAKKPFPGKDAWEKAYPADPSILVKKKLQEYLQLVTTVDFNAQLTASGRKSKFVNPVYEKKSQQWKACYRAGKEVNEVVTAFVKEWMKGEIVPKNKIRMVEPAPASSTKKSEESKTAAPQANSNTQPVPVQDEPEATTQQPDSNAAPKPKEKKSLFNKLKDKAKGVIKY